ncbi:hypothetical protein [Peptococcus niger]|uniref:Uncharacterized protein n=1 Tax=Peptococcus niger TaxID=2741 RepID=A0A1G6VZD2_PEPNI|nr:hypothetical protein [Peptococcus niger]SDD59080.1 hypothetical protein SAMN04489866_104189 [Peptococcus niger]
MNELDKKAFIEYMANYGYTVEFDSNTPGFFDSSGELIARIDEVLSLSALKPPELEEDFYAQDFVEGVTAYIDSDVQFSLEKNHTNFSYLSPDSTKSLICQKPSQIYDTNVRPANIDTGSAA